MGDGVDAPVRAIAAVGGDVYVGGEFTTVANGTVEASRLARWDGTGWSPVAGGVSSSRTWDLVSVRALASDGEKLYVAGLFDTAGSGDGGIQANGFAALDLATGAWETYDGGLWFPADPGEGRALALLGGRLYVAGSFERAGTVETTSFAVLDLAAKTWEGYGAGLRNGDLAGTADALAVDEATGTVFIGGRFTAAGDVVTSGLATFADAEYGSLGAFTYGSGDTQTVNVIALAHTPGGLYAGGVFTHVDDVEVNWWAVHDETGWRTPASLDGEVHALAAHPDGVVVAGWFGFSDDLRMQRAGVWTGTTWRTFGQGVAHDPHGDGFVYAVVATESGMYAGGFFDQAGPVAVDAVAEWRDGAWHDLAGGLHSPAAAGEVYAMLRVGTDLYVTGQFESAGGEPAANIARWDGTRWSPLGGGIQGTGLALTVMAGRLYVGGGFFQAGDVRVSNVAAWDLASETWSAIGSVPTYDGNVMALAPLLDRYLLIGGRFSKLWSGRFQASGQNSLVLFDTHAPPDPADPVAGYFRVPGVTFSWMPGAVQALQVLGNDVWLGGTFERAGVTSWTDPPGEGFAAPNLAVWRDFASDTANWATPGGTDHQVTAFTTLDGRSLVVGGWFDHAGPIAASGVVEHDPSTGAWTPYGSGIGWGARSGPTVRALAQSPADGVWVGGTFTVAGGVPSCNLALWRGTAGRSP